MSQRRYSNALIRRDGVFEAMASVSVPTQDEVVPAE
jgi:hypothetical protein